MGYQSEVDVKAHHLLQYLYQSSSKRVPDLLPVRDYALIYAVDADEFEIVVDYAESKGWIVWGGKSTISLSRIQYRDVKLTLLGIKEVEYNSIVFEDIINCPLTGLPLNGRAAFKPLNGSEEVLYTFEPIGCAIFKRNDLLGLLQSISDGLLPYNINLASLCREAHERGHPVPVLTNEMLHHLKGKFPTEFEEKQMHFLRLLYDIGGRERRSRTIRVKDDFTLAFAQDADQFYRIVESLLDEGLLRYDENSVVAGDFEGDIQLCYPDMLLTPAGKQAAKETITIPTTTVAPQLLAPLLSSNLAALHPTIQQVAGSLLASAHYPQAILAACTALDKMVQYKAKLPATTVGTALMTTAFSAKNPLIQISQDMNEQMGFMNLYQGSVQAIRNHYAHNLTEIPAPRALEWLSFISALFYKLDETLPSSDSNID